MGAPAPGAPMLPTPVSVHDICQTQSLVVDSMQSTIVQLLCRSSWRSSWSWRSEITRIILASSANKRQSELLMQLGKSLIYIRNSSGPSMLPCGTPNVTGRVPD